MILNFNIVTIILFSVFIIPIIAGILSAFSRERVRYSFESLLNNIEFLIGLVASIYLARKIFFDRDTAIYKKLYELVPEAVKTFLHGQDILTYVVAVPVFLMVILMLVRLITTPLYRYFIVPLSEELSSVIGAMPGFIQRIAGGLWQLPRAVYSLLIVALLMNFYTYYIYSPQLSKWMKESEVYQAIYDKAIYPALNSNLAKQIPVLVNDSFRKTAENSVPGKKDNSGSITDRIARQLSDRNIKVIEYFNGVTLDEAIKTTPEIDKTSREIVQNETQDTRKAYLIYKWVSRNVQYDYAKVEKVSKDPRGIPSGAMEAFHTRKGICFDYSSLYVAMCRAVGLKVRLVTGLGYSGISWGDHAWNQVYSSEEGRWINVDTTFGSVANYFDKSDFGVDHKYDDVQGEW